MTNLKDFDRQFWSDTLMSTGPSELYRPDNTTGDQFPRRTAKEALKLVQDAQRVKRYERTIKTAWWLTVTVEALGLIAVTYWVTSVLIVAFA